MILLWELCNKMILDSVTLLCDFVLPQIQSRCRAPIRHLVLVSKCELGLGGSDVVDRLCMWRATLPHMTKPPIKLTRDNLLEALVASTASQGDGDELRARMQRENEEWEGDDAEPEDVYGVFDGANSMSMGTGMNDPMERHPFKDGPKEADLDVELNPRTFVCICGCRYAAEVLDQLPTLGGDKKWLQPHRICTRFHEGGDEEGGGGEWDLTHQEMFACSEFAPRFYDLRGQARRLGNWVDVWYAREQLIEGISGWLKPRLARAIKPKLDQLGLTSTIQENHERNER